GAPSPSAARRRRAAAHCADRLWTARGSAARGRSGLRCASDQAGVPGAARARDRRRQRPRQTARARRGCRLTIRSDRDMTKDPAPPVARGELTRVVLSVLLIAMLIAASFWVLRPFLLSVIWGAMIVVATWPLMLKVQAIVRRRGLAVSVMTVAMLLIFVVPLILAVQAVVGNIDTITRFLRALPEWTIPLPPDWVSGIPLVGAKIAETWTEVAAAGVTDLAGRLRPFMEDAAEWGAGAFGRLGLFTDELLLAC